MAKTFTFKGEYFILEVDTNKSGISILLRERDDSEEAKRQAWNIIEEEGLMFVDLPKEQAIELAKQILEVFSKSTPNT